MKMITDFHQVLRLRMMGAILLHRIYAFMNRDKFTLHVTVTMEPALTDTGVEMVGVLG
jgi:hypothetical protein